MTAVEFLLEKYKSQNTLLFSDDFEQALEMERQQIENAYDHYRCIGNFDNGIEYYNEIHKKP